MPRRQKIGLIAVLSLSLLIIVAAIVRAVRVVQEIESTVGAIPYESYDITIWTSVEINTALFCAAAPSLKPLIQKMIPGVLSSRSYTSGENRDGREARAGGATILRRGTEDFEMGSQVELGSEREEGDSWTGKRHEPTVEVCESASERDYVAR